MPKSLAVKRRILVVDDDSISAQMLKYLLQEEYDVIVSDNGQAALSIAQSDPQPDLILLDVQMPDLSGYDVCRKLRDEVATKKIPVIFITGKDSESDEMAGFEAGAVDYVTKPFHPVLIKARMRIHLELKNQRDILENISALDGLTGIANRRRFDDSLLVAVAYASRNSFPLSLIMIDIDNFKLFNDNYGHYDGDICLVKVARAIEGNVMRQTDTAARYGGEEFACILPAAKHGDALALAERIRRDVLALKIPHEYSDVSEYITISLGVATVFAYDNNGVAQKLIVAADRAMYAAKDGGRNRVVGIDL